MDVLSVPLNCALRVVQVAILFYVHSSTISKELEPSPRQLMVQRERRQETARQRAASVREPQQHESTQAEHPPGSRVSIPTPPLSSRLALPASGSPRMLSPLPEGGSLISAPGGSFFILFPPT